MIANPKGCWGTLLSATVLALAVPGLVGAQAAVSAIPESSDMAVGTPWEGMSLGASFVRSAPAPAKASGAPADAGDAAAAGDTADAADAAEAADTADVELTGFRDVQLRYARVRRAHTTRAARVEARFLAQGIEQPAEIFFRVFKREQLFEVWARDADAASFVMVNTYPVCGTSGELGPKRQEGDAQIPEGFYHIDLFNPASNFHLSLRVDYPNAVDRARGTQGDLGGDIFIHGGCSTIGCVPVTDRWMEEIYLMAVNARDAGQERIPVHLFPTHLDDDGMDWLRNRYGADHPDYEFWRSLRPGYEAFEKTRVVPPVAHQGGRYVFPVGVASQ